MEKRARISLLVSAALAGVLAFSGGWARRWISDDGLIVLRTVRNILAGNGPVFNIGERVETNTSTLWQYLIVAFSWVPGMRLEDVAMWLALILTVVGVVAATMGSGKLWQRVHPGLVAPFGVLIYLALPPARDFATSGLEWGLSLTWIGVWWALLVRWSADGRAQLWLAFWAGLSWLVRPELALYGGITGIVLLAANRRDWKQIGLILAAALPVPAGYEIFRMGYYGLLTPHTAVAKSASGAYWGTGARYVWDTVSPYALWAPVLVAAALGIYWALRLSSREKLVAAVAVGCGLLHLLYVVRVGGDFMHGRMVLLPLFAMLLPVAAVPLTLVGGICAAAAALWAGIVVARGHDLGFEPFEDGPENLTIVDEREFWTAVLLRESGNPPRYAEDFLTSDLMNGWTDGVAQAEEENSGALAIILKQKDPFVYDWLPLDRVSKDSDLQNLAPTAYLINLGMVSANSDLNMRVLDDVGLATPLAARQPRIEGGRIGHDKHLPGHWKFADTAADTGALLGDIDAQKVREARAALRTPEIAELLATSREPMSPRRFAENMRFALTKGRTLEIAEDPAVYLDDETLARIEGGEDVGLSGQRIAWPVQ
ncbi:MULTISPECIES: hypothetical protein [unclassified Corynebacterium]|uniref:hypothetical protein n=1 Tax=unclassified Corynebacterium TaxID=2624378 RepID=UPI0021A9A2F3|nr:MULTISPECIES: hypothetical protein [unclassified Corynebacterium]MCT1453097.1 hypothetical protein [Corynebacterium sp. p3-SID1145]MCT1462208.1 hypothetical protein [Corynebacterium sp. p3-SID1140]MDN8595385.1 hypothetical protein [Corynebacterium sp. P4_F2]WKK55281.1 hypothetical protein QYR03_08775 [Corynebacterium sp. P4-C1]WKK62689.1 hypothetical protein QYR04_07475 [Corynebacterium sp. P8-C1]